MTLTYSYMKMGGVIAIDSDDVSKAGTHPRASQITKLICIVTALQDPELDALLDINWEWEREEYPDDPTVYHRSSILKNGNRETVIAASAPRMGSIAAAILSTKIINRFKPHYLAMVGVLAGVRVNDCSVGDVIAADPRWDWGSGKYVTEGGTHIFSPAPYQTNLNPLYAASFR